MRRLNFSYSAFLEFEEPVETQFFALRITPPEDEGQHIEELRTLILPATSKWHYTDGFGNVVTCGTSREPHCDFSFMIQGTAYLDTRTPRTEKPLPVFRHASPLTAPSSEIVEFLNQSINPQANVEEVSEMLMAELSRVLAYKPGSTQVTTTAAEAFLQKSGVCQDFTHIMLALLRERRIPARYCAGITLGEGATHAWVEVFDGVQWLGFDPTRNKRVDDSYMVLSRGRDFTDCSIDRGIIRGGGTQTQSVRMKVQEQ